MPAEPDASTPPLKRHPALQPLSREHMNGLIQARRLTRAADTDDTELRREAVAGFVAAWHAEIREHFDDEERILLPLTGNPALRERLLKEHELLRAAARRCIEETDAVIRDSEFLRRAGAALHDHIRWEEREYFEQIQRDHPEALASLHHEADHIETRRPGARPRRSL